MARKPRFTSLKTKLILYFLVISVIPTVVLSFNFFGEAWKLTRQNSSDLMLEVSRQIAQRLEEFFTDLEKTTLFIAYSTVTGSPSAVQEFLTKGDITSERLAFEALSNAIMARDRTIAIYIYNMGPGKDLFANLGQPINWDWTPRKESWFREFLASDRFTTVIATHRDNQAKAASPWVMTHARKIFDMDNGQLRGVMVVNVSMDFVERICGNILAGRQARLTIIDDTRRILYDQDATAIGQPASSLFGEAGTFGPDPHGSLLAEIKGSSRILTWQSFARLPWKILFSVSSEELDMRRQLMQRSILETSLVIIALALVFLWIISTLVTLPIKRLAQGMERLRGGDFDSPLPHDSHDEIGTLAQNFLTMSQDLKLMMQRIRETERLKAAAELNALQAQINPHFMYNTLTTVKWIAAMQNSTKIVEVTEALIGLLRYSAGSDGQETTLEQELASIRAYVTIQQARYYNRLQVEYRIEPTVLACRSLKFLLQPLVENAIFHGLAGQEQGGKILVSMSREGQTVRIGVTDFGVGMDPPTLERVRHLLLPDGPRDNHIGLGNVATRLHLHYGADFRLDCRSSPGEGSSFSLIIPWDPLPVPTETGVHP